MLSLVVSAVMNVIHFPLICASECAALPSHVYIASVCVSVKVCLCVL